MRQVFGSLSSYENHISEMRLCLLPKMLGRMMWPPMTREQILLRNSDGRRSSGESRWFWAVPSVRPAKASVPVTQDFYVSTIHVETDCDMKRMSGMRVETGYGGNSLMWKWQALPRDWKVGVTRLHLNIKNPLWPMPRTDFDARLFASLVLEKRPKLSICFRALPVSRPRYRNLD